MRSNYNRMCNTNVFKVANMVEKQMKRYIKMQTIMDVQVYEELDRRKFKIDLISGGNNKVLVVIYRK